MVKIEDCDTDGAVSTGAKVLRNAAMIEGQPSSSSSNLRSQFIDMGFSPMMVDKILQKHGDHDSNTILESLLSDSVKIEDCDENGAVSAGAKVLRNAAVIEGQPSSSSSNLRSQFIDMGFSPMVVDKMLQKHGGHDSNTILESLLSTSAHHNSRSESSSSLGSFFDSDNEDTSSPLVSRIDAKQDSHRRLSFYDGDAENKRFKKAKHLLRDDGGASSSGAVTTPWLSGCVRSLSNVPMKGDHKMALGSRGKVHGCLARPPYFLYGNIVDVSKDTWQELSVFLYSVQPEFVNCQSFSALTRKEGYIHNLQTEGRCIVGSNSRMPIEDALPLTIEDPMQPHQLEVALGYPSGHTDMLGLNPQDRIAAMRFGFQTDTVGHLLSVLKDIYPNGIKVLSVYSGVGGTEVALHRLGIPLKCVVSVEESEINRKILKQWWGKTEQAGQLIQLSSIKKLGIDQLENLIDQFSGFDLVVGGTYSSWRGGGKTMNAKMGMDAGQFYDYVRVVKTVGP